MRRTAAILLTALLVVTAGCGGSIGGDGTPGAGDRTGTVNFYVSDQQNAIGDFAHLNVTVTRVGLHRTTATRARNGTGNGTGNASGEWIEHEVDNVTVDLTELQGENATRLGALDAPNGTYNMVFVYVDGVDATLENGESVDVKLPSQKLRLNEQFTLGADEEVDFVYDLTVQETGNGRYILKPVASQSGTDVPIEERPAAKSGQGERGGAQNGAGQNRTPTRGNVRLYVSDQPNAIDDFEHLNVTITKVGFQRSDKDDAGDASDQEAADDGTANETDDSDDSKANESEAGDSGDDSANESEADDSGDDTGNETDTEAAEGGGWVEHDVDAATVDLTELRGANATRIGDLDVPAGRYGKVFVYVSEMNATLEGGEHVTVKLPSEKLQLQKGFTVGDGEDVDFVYDIAVHQAGKSGKYVLRPVVSQSGTDDEVEIEERERHGDDHAEEAEDAEGEGESALEATFTTNVTAGENATLRVTRNGSAVANATVEVDGEEVGRTDDGGTITFAVPGDAEELEVNVTSGDLETELERDLSAGDDGSDDEREGGNDTESGGDNDTESGGDNDTESGGDNDTESGGSQS